MKSEKLPCSILSVSLFLFMSLSAAKKCYQCKHMPIPRSCQVLTDCALDYTCYVERIVVTGSTYYNSGCMLTRQCPQPGASALVGRRDLSIRQSHREIECCQHEYCNNEAFGLTLIPQILRGPTCFACNYETDPSKCYITYMCAKDEVCFLETHQSLSGTVYNSGCVNTHACRGGHHFTRSSIHECCSADYCNDRFLHHHVHTIAHSTSEVTTRSTPTTSITTPSSTNNTPSSTKTKPVSNKATHSNVKTTHTTNRRTPTTTSTTPTSTKATPTTTKVTPTTTKTTPTTTKTTPTTVKTTPTTTKVTPITTKTTPTTIKTTPTTSKTTPTTIKTTTATTKTTPTTIKTTSATTKTPSSTQTTPSTAKATPFRLTMTSGSATTTSINNTVSSTTVSDKQLIEQACRKLLFKGYYYDSFTNLCIRVEKANMTRSHAQRACAADGASLMVVDEAKKQDLLIYWIFSHRINDTDFWIGAKSDTNRGDKFHWDDGSELSHKTYNNWGNYLMGQPDDRRVKDENCVYMDYIDNYFWHDDKCSATKTGFICEIGPMSPAQAEAECRRHVFGGFYYDHKTNFCISMRAKQNVTHAQAASACAQYHAHLVNIDSAEKMSFLLTWIFSNQINQTHFWVGATDKFDNSSFYWTDGAKLQYTHWGGPDIPPPVALGQPDEPRVTNQDCVYLDYVHNYYWFDDNCHNKRKGFICEMPDNGHLATSCRTQFSQGYFYDYFSNMCIKLHITSGVTQNQASVECQRESARLVTIGNDRKTNFVLTWIFSHRINDTDFWIGLKDLYNTSAFYWPSGAKLTYTHWYTVKPPPPKNCVILDHINNYKWLTAECDKPRTGYICEVNKRTLSMQPSG